MSIFKSFLIKIKNKLANLGGRGSSGIIFKNMGILATGTIISKLIGFGTYPVITRIYSPADFGVLAVYSATIYILLPFATMRYSVAIPLPKNDILAFNILTLGFVILIMFSGILSLVFVSSGNTIFEFFNIGEISEYWWLLLLGVIGAALYDSLADWATRKIRFGPVAKTDVWRSLISAIIKIVLGLFGYKPIGLLIGEASHKVGGGIYLIKSFFKDIKENVSSLSRKHMTFLFRHYKNFPLYHMPSDFLLVFSSKVPILFFAYQFGAEHSGQLGLSMMIISIPMRLIGNTTAKAYYAEIAKIGIKEREQLLNLTKSIIKRLSAFSLVTFIALLFSPMLFAFIFGNEWLQAGEFTRILSVYLLLEFITTPLLNIFNLFNEQSKFLKTSFIRALLIGGAFSISVILSFNAYEVLYLYTAFMCLHFINLGYQLYKIIHS